jgi:hypothetical protein
MGNIERVDATKLVVGQEAREFAMVWRRQRFQGYSPTACHQPPYAIKFYFRGKVVLFATICWTCDNVTFIVPHRKAWVAFVSDSREAVRLKEMFQKAFPSDRKVG